MSKDLVCRTAPKSPEVSPEPAPKLANPDRANDGRLNGEWFERCPEIEEEIARLSTPPLPGYGR